MPEREDQPEGDDPLEDLLRHLSDGDEGVTDELFRLVYDELHLLARNRMRGQPPDHTLQATALVNEAFLKLFQNGAPDYQNRQHFLGLASKAMRSILVDHARAKNSAKRKPKGECIQLDAVTASYEERAFDLIALDDALTRLTKVDEQMVRIVELRFFGGLSTQETAEVLQISTRKVERDWAAAKAWLRREIK